MQRQAILTNWNDFILKHPALVNDLLQFKEKLNFIHDLSSNFKEKIEWSTNSTTIQRANKSKLLRNAHNIKLLSNADKIDQNLNEQKQIKVSHQLEKSQGLINANQESSTVSNGTNVVQIEVPINTESNFMLSNKKNLSNKLIDVSKSFNEFNLASFILGTALTFVYLQSVVFKFSSNEKEILFADGIDLFDLGACSINHVRQGGYYTILWSIFLHTSLMHYLVNIICLLLLIEYLKNYMTTFRILVIFIGSALYGNITSILLDSCKGLVGASGGLYGLASALLISFLERDFYNRRTLIILLCMLTCIILFILMSISSDVATWAHIGGFIGGFLLGLITLESLFFFDKNSVRHKKKKIETFRFITVITYMTPSNWSIGLTIIRFLSAGLFICSLVLCHILIYFKYKYQPLGTLTWTGLLPCCCCNIDKNELNKVINWVCLNCNSLPFEASSITWADHCGLITN